MYYTENIRNFNLVEVQSLGYSINPVYNRVTAENGLTKKEYDSLLKMAQEMAKSSDEKESLYGKNREMLYIALLNNPTNAVNLANDIKAAKTNYEDLKTEYEKLKSPGFLSKIFRRFRNFADCKREYDVSKQRYEKIQENIVSLSTFLEYKKYYDSMLKN